jgi:hypothetical protein
MVQEEKAFRAASSLFRFGIIALLILGSLSLKSCFKEPKPEPVVVEAPKQTPSKPGPIERALVLFMISGSPFTTEWTSMNKEQQMAYLFNHPNNVTNILRIILLMQNERSDINKDDLVNYIDYAIMFRKLYGTKARIIQNNNPDNGMNHLFIIVNDGDFTWEVEPRGTYEAFLMPEVWGGKYDRTYNLDVTAQYERFLTR